MNSAAAPIVERLTDREERFERLRKQVGVIAAPLALVLTYWFTPELAPEGRRLASILALVGVLWVTEAIPLPASALLGAGLAIVAGVASAKQVLAHFADPVMFVFIGGFILARAMTVHRLDRRIALAVISLPIVGDSPLRLMIALGLATAGVSMWVSNTATAAMMLPITIGVLRALHEARVDRGEADGPMDARSWPYATALILAVAYAASVGGLGTPVGSPPNLVGLAQIAATANRDIGFLQWMLLTLPMVAVMTAVLFAMLWFMDGRARTPATSGGGALAGYLADQRAELGPLSRGEQNTLIAFGAAVVGWVLPGVLDAVLGADSAAAQLVGDRLPESAVAILAAVLVMILPIDVRTGQLTLPWREAQRIDWGIVLLYGGGMTLGALMESTGVSRALGDAVVALFDVHSLWGLTALAIGMAIVLSEMTSNIASANMLVPVAIAVAQSAEVSPIPPALGACIGASFGFMLPVSTAPNAMAYGSGLVPVTAMMRAGVVFDLIGFVIIWCGLRTLCPALGLI